VRVTPAEPDAGTGLPIGPAVAGPDARPPGGVVLEGRYCRLEPLDAARHGDALFAASTPPDGAARFLYLSTGPPEDRAAFDAWLAGAVASPDRRYYAVVDARTGRAEGRQAFLRIRPADRSIEIGDVYWGPAIARSRVSTEACARFARHAFEDLGYRRFEWKCNVLNAPSMRAAVRFGFVPEGVFRHDMVVRGRTRDTAWFSMIDTEWPAHRAAFDAWLAPDNFDAHGVQRRTLVQVREDLGVV
jgi:RimJ/RimL family protein N-acetyltransferase